MIFRKFQSPVKTEQKLKKFSQTKRGLIIPFSMQALPSEPESIIVLEMFGTETQSASTVHLNIGLQVLLLKTLSR